MYGRNHSLYLACLHLVETSTLPVFYDLMNVAACADEMSGGPAGRSRPAAHAAAARHQDGGR